MSRRSRRGVEGVVDRVGRACEALLGSPGGIRLAVGVSGGVDSTVLMHLLAELGYAPTVISLDHGLRTEAGAEVAQVGRQADSLGLRFISGRLAVSPGPDLAARARAARYARFEQICAAEELALLATAHHRDDQAETVVDRLIRGGGSRGLGGIAPRRGRYVRPLLDEPRAALEAWASARGLQWSDDPSNRRYTRGQIRHAILPALEAIRPGASAVIARSAKRLREDDALLCDLAAPLVTPEGLLPSGWGAAAAPLQRRALLLLAEAAGAPAPSSDHLDAALRLRRPGSWSPLPGGWRFALDAAALRCLPPPPAAAALSGGAWGLWRVESDAPVRLRAPRAGEQIEGSSLAARMRAAGIPAGLRPYQPVVEYGDRVWVPGVWRPAPDPSGVQVSCERPRAPSIPRGGPYSLSL